MKSRSMILFMAAVYAAVLSAETVKLLDREVYVKEANYDASKIAPYTLEDPLEFVDGTKVATPADWARRRREILDIFAREMYGAEPPKPNRGKANLASRIRTIEKSPRRPRPFA